MGKLCNLRCSTKSQIRKETCIYTDNMLKRIVNSSSVQSRDKRIRAGPLRFIDVDICLACKTNMYDDGHVYELFNQTHKWAILEWIISNKYCHTDNHYSVHLSYIYAKLYVVTESYMQNIPQYIRFCKY